MLYIILMTVVALWIIIAAALAIHAPKTQPEPTRDQRTGRVSASKETTRGAFLSQVYLGLVVAVLLTVAFSMTIVSARTVGVYTSFGKEVGTKQAGMGWTAPWVAKKQEMPTNVQYLVLAGGDNGQGSTNVKYKGGGGGQVDATVRWTMDPAKAVFLWRKYQAFEKVSDQLVKGAARDAINVAVGAYSPSDATSGENRRAITDTIKSDLDATLSDDGIRIDSVSISDIRLDEKTQQSIEAIVKANAAIQQAQAEQTRAKIDNATAKLRAESGSLSGPALVRYCLDITNSWNQNNNGKLPETWNCGLGSVGQTPLIINPSNR